MSSKIDVYISVPSFEGDDVRGKTAVIIDVLRASTTMVTAIKNGAKGIIPVDNMDTAGRISQNLDSLHYLLCGEKDGKKIEGYHLGNSPLEYTPEAVEGKTIILNTTNGTKAVKKAAPADEVIIACFSNLKSVIKKIKSEDREIALICAGWRGQLSLEDLLCAGNIISELCAGSIPKDSRDSVRVAFGLYKNFENNIAETINSSNHAKRLNNIVESNDITYSSKKNITDVLPVLEDGIITNLNGKKS